MNPANQVVMPTKEQQDALAEANSAITKLQGMAGGAAVVWGQLREALAEDRDEPEARVVERVERAQLVTA